jgi:hypothetical protein
MTQKCGKCGGVMKEREGIHGLFMYCPSGTVANPHPTQKVSPRRPVQKKNVNFTKGGYHGPLDDDFDHWGEAFDHGAES